MSNVCGCVIGGVDVVDTMEVKLVIPCRISLVQESYPFFKSSIHSFFQSFIRVPSLSVSLTSICRVQYSLQSQPADSSCVTCLARALLQKYLALFFSLTTQLDPQQRFIQPSSIRVAEDAFA